MSPVDPTHERPLRRADGRPPRRVFLSGRIDGVELEEAAVWRLRVAERLHAAGFTTYDPTRVMRNAAAAYRPTPNEVFTNDRWNLARADVMLVNLTLPPMIASREAPFFTIGGRVVMYVVNGRVWGRALYQSEPRRVGFETQRIA